MQSLVGWLLDLERAAFGRNVDRARVRGPVSDHSPGRVIVLATGHFMSPIALAWRHSGYREIMMRRRIKFVLVPLAIVSVGSSAAYICSLFFPPVHVNPDTFALAAQSLKIMRIRWR
jgi:hypothetical protein